MNPKKRLDVVEAVRLSEDHAHDEEDDRAGLEGRIHTEPVVGSDSKESRAFLVIR
jgi:hypothetical protein